MSEIQQISKVDMPVGEPIEAVRYAVIVQGDKVRLQFSQKIGALLLTHAGAKQLAQQLMATAHELTGNTPITRVKPWEKDK